MNINAEELRLGNYIEQGVVSSILYNDGILGCLIRKNDFDSSGGLFVPIQDAVAIKLCEDVILKLGFKKIGDYYYNQEKSIRLSHSVHVHHAYFLELGYSSFDTSSDEWRMINDVSEVHELQNLYFAITEENLKYNLIK